MHTAACRSLFLRARQAGLDADRIHRQTSVPPGPQRCVVHAGAGKDVRVLGNARQAVQGSHLGNKTSKGRARRLREGYFAHISIGAGVDISGGGHRWTLTIHKSSRWSPVSLNLAALIGKLRAHRVL